MKLIGIEENKSLKRDLDSNAIINTNTNDYTEYRNKKKAKLEELSRKKQQEEQLQYQQQQINSLESEIKEIKTLLIQLLEKDSNVSK